MSELPRQRLHQLASHGGAGRGMAQMFSDRRLSGQEERSCFGGRQSGQIGAEAVEQLDAAVRPLHREDRHPGCTERVDIA
ncbi:MAG: hypothetical protein M3Z46_02425 [Actinomycetota bacterium]|nr:hypothetical protein [Actinomycetota bacterium]